MAAMDNVNVKDLGLPQRLYKPGVILLCSGVAICSLMMVGYSHMSAIKTILPGYSRSAVIKNYFRFKSNNYKSTKPCTFGLFREVYAHDHYFPSGGRWVNSTPGNILHYQPQACQFKYPRITKTFIDSCLAKANISSIMTMGDSTASRYFKALIKTQSNTCQDIRKEKLAEHGFLPDLSYYTSQIQAAIRKFVEVKFRFCSGCASYQLLCNTSKSSTRFEHIAQTMILDDSIQITFPNYSHAASVMSETWSLTSQEFTFRYFLKNRYPDVFLIFLPFVHAKHNMNIDRVRMEIQYFKSLVDYYIPNTTKIIYLPAYSEFEEARNKLPWNGRRYNGLLASEVIKEMNHILYELLEPDLLRRGGKDFAFLDVFEASLPHAAWCTDGVHMKPVWYEHVMTMFWETYCNSVFMDDF